MNSFIQPESHPVRGARQTTRSAASVLYLQFYGNKWTLYYNGENTNQTYYHQSCFSDSDKVLEHGCLIFMRAVKVKDLRFCCREKGKQACDSDFASQSFCLTVRETFKHFKFSFCSILISIWALTLGINKATLPNKWRRVSSFQRFELNKIM